MQSYKIFNAYPIGIGNLTDNVYQTCFVSKELHLFFLQK